MVPPDPPESSRGRPSVARAWPGLFAAGITAFAGILLTPWRDSLDPDSAVFALAGRIVREGGLPYRDVWVGKPPVLIVLDAIAGGLGQIAGLGEAVGVRGLSLLAAILASLAMLAIARSHGLRPLTSVLAGVGAGIILVHPAFSSGGGLSEPPAFALALTAWALVSGGQHHSWRWFAAGALVSLAVGTSLLAAAFLPLLAFETVAIRDVTIRSAAFLRSVFRRVTLLIAGGLAGGLPILIWLAAGGALGSMWDDVVIYSRIYSATQCPIAGWSGWPCFSNADPRVTLIAGVVVVGLACVSLGLVLRRPRHWPWLAFFLLGMLTLVAWPQLQRVPVAHYLWPILLGLVIPGIVGLEAIVITVIDGGRRRWIGLTLSIVALLGLTGSTIGAGLLADAAYRGENHLDRYQGLAAVVDRAEPIQAPLFIWGLVSPLYFLSDRQPVGSYIHMFPFMLSGYTTEQRVHGLCELIARDRPVLAAEGMAISLLEPGGVIPAGEDPAWFTPVRSMIARAWHDAGSFGAVRVLAPTAGISTSPTDCAVR